MCLNKALKKRGIINVLLLEFCRGEFGQGS